MDGRFDTDGFQLSADALGQLMPMYLWLDPSGVIRDGGPTLRKILGMDLVGRKFDDVFSLRRPQRFTTVADLARKPRLRLILRPPRATHFKAVCVPMGTQNGVLLNLSFGFAVREAVRDHGLSDTDFAPTDLAIELLYLAEAKAAVMGEVDKMAARLRGAKKRAEEQALTDELTGLGNRRSMELMLSQLLKGRDGFALLHLDLDYFKQVNDTLGHAAGDHVLHEVARILKSSVRGGDLVARVGGDEFVVLLPGVSDAAPVVRVGRSILKALEKPIRFEGEICRVSMSIGAVLVPPSSGSSMDMFLNQSDEALYASKRAGRGRLTMFEGPKKMRELYVYGSGESGRDKRHTQPE